MQPSLNESRHAATVARRGAEGPVLDESPRVIAISTSKPRTIEMNGVPIVTSLVRDPATGPLYFGADGPEGNEMAVHTERVYAFPIERYAFWGKELGLDSDAWPLCFWGENITLTQFDEDDVRVGDLLHFSGGAVLEITGPRIPCMKMAWRLGMPPSVLKRLVEVGGLGFYMRVIKTGLIDAGETIRLERPYPENITINDLARLHDRAASADVDLLQKVAETPRIALQSREMLLRVVEHMNDEALTTRNRWTGWRRFIVRQRTAEPDGVTSFRLTPEDGQPVAPYRAGQFLPVRVPSPDRADLTRTWSLSDYVGADGDYRISIKRVEGGVGSTYMCDTVREGDCVEIRPPVGRFVLNRSPIRPVVLISAGIGITPMLAMLRAHTESTFPLPVTWIHSTRNSEAHLFRNEADRLIALSDQYDSRVHYTQPLPTDRAGEHYYAKGRIDRESLKALVEETSHYQLVGKAIELSGRSREFYICGPRDFERDVRAWLVELGVPDHYIRSESFTPHDGESETAPTLQAAEVRFARTDKVALWQADSGQALLDTAEAAGLSPDFGCRNGSCQACAARLIEGRVEYALPPSSEPPEGSILLCCSRPATPVVVLDL